MKRLSSGIRINSASDDAAGLSLSEKLKSVINGNTVAKNNAQTGISMLNTADSALSLMSTSLERIRNLAVQAANGVYSSTERQMIQAEVSQLSSDIRQTYASTKFSDKNVFGGEVSAEMASAIAAGYNEAHIITTAADFVSKITADLGGTFILAGDIDLGELGTLANSAITGTFTGTLNGNGHTIRNIDIDTKGAAINYIGVFSRVTGTIQNIAVSNINITALNSSYIGGFIGSQGNVNNAAISDVNITVGDNCGRIGGFMGSSNDAINNVQTSNINIIAGNNCDTIGGFMGGQGEAISNSFASSINIKTGNDTGFMGGFIGDLNNIVSECYASGNITAGNDSSFAGFGGTPDAGDNISNCYASVNLNSGANGKVAGFVYGNGVGSITSSYATGNLNSPTTYGFSSYNNSDNSNFYMNNATSDNSSAVDGSTSPLPTGAWSSAIWDKSTPTPTLKNCGATLSATYNSSQTMQIGDDSNTYSQINILSRYILGNVDFSVSSLSDAQASIKKIDTKMDEINSYRSNVGASVNKFSSILNIQDNRINNLSASKSTIYDADIATESADMVKTKIKTQASSALLSQVKGLDANLLMQLLQ